MASRQNSRDRQMRHRIAQEAARLMSAEGIRDFYAAKRKAAERLGAPNTQNMPRNLEVEEALEEYQRIFVGSEYEQHLRMLREAAREAMRFFDAFQPRLTGSVLSGTASEHSDVNLHLFADSPEEVHLFLMEAGVPFEQGQRRLRINREESQDFPLVRFLAGEVMIEALLLPLTRLHHAPLSPVDGRPMQRASLRHLDALLAETREATA